MAVIDEHKGIVVAGGVDAPNKVEFLDWEGDDHIGTSWHQAFELVWSKRKIFSKSMGASNVCTFVTLFMIILAYMPGVGNIGGNLAVVGGYLWPDTTDYEVEFCKEECKKASEEGRFRNENDKLWYNSASVTVPGSMFPEC